MPSLPKTIFNNKFSILPLPPPGTFQGQTVLVTGASGGIGLATAVHFVNLGASSVIITARSIAKGATAKASIEAQTNTANKNVVKIMVLDMSTIAGTKDFADRLKSEVRNINVVILNAGVFNLAFKLMSGYEETIQVNVLSTALLGLLLLPWMKEAGKGKAHLGVVTSGIIKDVDIGGKWPQKDILTFFSKAENRPSGMNGMYGSSKLLEQYVVNECARLAVGKDGSAEVIVNSICPGMVKSDLGREARTNALMGFALDAMMKIMLKTTEVGARMLVRSALTKKEENGKHISDVPGEEFRQSVQHNILGPEGQKMQERVWKEVVIILEQEVAEVKEIAKITTV